MSSPDQSPSNSRLISWSRLQRIVASFEQAWRQGAHPSIDSYVQPAMTGYPVILMELVHRDLEYRLKGGEAVRVEDYLVRYPEVAPDKELVLGLIAVEYARRRLTEPDLGPEEYLGRFPQYASDVPAALRTGSAGSEILTLVPLKSAGPVMPAISFRAAPATGFDAAAVQGGPTVAGYVLLDELGRGGMGVVYKAHHIELKRLVALKMILAGGHAGPDQLARFKSEAEAVARLQHPNIVQIYEIGEAEGWPFFSLEYVEGGSLEQKFHGTPQPANQAARLVETLARAMHAAHQRGIVHRDLKPANVLLTADGQPKITDFGLAKHLDMEQGQTQSGAIVGTPSYMAPEQAAGKRKAIGPATDVYALGAILYELLTGRPPFKAANPVDTLLQVAADEPVPPSRLQPKVPRDLEIICLKCLAKEPGRRYQTAADLAHDLRRFLAGTPIKARPVGKVERSWRWCKRNPGLAVMGSLAVVALVAEMVVFTVFFIHVSQTANREARAAERLRHEEQATREALQEATTQRRLADQAAEKLRQEQQAAQAALKDANTQRRLVEKQRQLVGDWTQLADKRLAENYLDRGLALCNQQGDPAHGILWLCKALEVAPSRERSLQRVIRANLADWSNEVPALQAVLKHGERVNAVAFSPNGKTVMTGSEDKTARLWDAVIGKPKGAPLRHQGWVNAVAFSPDGQIALTGSSDHSGQLWDIATGKPKGAPLRHQDAVIAVAFSPDGQTVLTGSSDHSARLWDTATGKPRGVPLRHQGRVEAVVFSPDGQTVLTGSQDKTARLWDAATGKPRGVPLRHQGWVNVVAFSPDGQTVLTGSQDKTARLWDAATGKARGAPLRHQAPVFVVAFSPDGKTLLTGSSDKTARLWDAATGKPIGAPLHHQGAVIAVAFSPDGKTVLTGSHDGTARLWSAATGKALGAPLRHQGLVNAVAFSPDGQTVLTGSDDNTARLWDAAIDKPSAALLRHESVVTTVAFSPDGKVALTGSWDHTARLWEAATGKPRGKPLRHLDLVTSVAFSPDSKTLLTGSRDHTARLWDAATGHPIGASLRHQGGVTTVAFSPDGKTGLTGSQDKTARLWDAATGKPRGKPLRHHGWVNAVAFSPDGQVVLTGSQDKTVLWDDNAARLWDVATGKPLGTPLGRHLWGVHAVAFSPDGQTVLTGSQDGTARLWDTATGKVLGAPLRHQGAVNAVAFSPDGQTALTASSDKTARLWDAATGKPIGNPLYHQGGVTAVTFSSDGQTALTGSQDNTARLWDTATGQPLGAPLRHQDAVVAVAFSPDGQTVLTGSWDRTARLWRVPEGMASRPNWISLWAQIFTGTLNPHRPQALDGPTWQECRQRLTKLGPPFKIWDAERRARRQQAANNPDLTWHERLGEESIKSGQWFAALFHLKPLIKAEPQQPRYFSWRGQARAGMGQWKQAAADLDKAMQLGEKPLSLLSLQALAHLGDGNLQGYRKACAALLQQFDSQNDAEMARLRNLAHTLRALDALAGSPGGGQAYALLLNHFGPAKSLDAVGGLWVCTITPGAVSNPQQIVRLVDQGLARQPKRVDLLTTRGRALYRAGRFEEAVQHLTEGIRTNQTNWAGDWLYLAMAHHRLGHAGEAQNWLNKAVTFLDNNPDTVKGWWWTFRVWVPVLRREAEALLKEKRAKPQK